MTLTDLVEVIPSDQKKVHSDDDIFAEARGLIFAGDVNTLHGEPGSTIIYKSALFGNIELRTADPNGESERQLQAHYLWNAGICMAEYISQGDNPIWSVEGENVLELGAGVGLNGIVATLAGAVQVTISDYPTESVLNNIRMNAEHSIGAGLRSRYIVQGYKWGDLDCEFASRNKNKFSRILAADCCWMQSEHEDLVHSVLHFLDPSPHARVFVIAGFHTGHKILAAFFATADKMGLEVEEIYEEDVNGNKQPWFQEPDGGLEKHRKSKEWLVVARLKRRPE